MNDNTVVEKEGVSFSDIWSIIKKYWVGLVIIIAGCALIGTLSAFLFMPKEYEAREDVICITTEDTSSLENTNLISQNFEIAYSLVTSNEAYKKTLDVLEEKGISITYKDFKKRISVEKNSPYKLIYKYTSDNKEEVPMVLNTFTDVTIKFIDETSSEKFKLNKVSSIGVQLEDVEEAGTSKVLIIVASAVVGVVIGLCYEFIANSLDKTIKNRSYIEDNFGIKVIGMIPDPMTSKEKKND